MYTAIPTANFLLTMWLGKASAVPIAKFHVRYRQAVAFVIQCTTRLLSGLFLEACIKNPNFAHALKSVKAFPVSHVYKTLKNSRNVLLGSANASELIGVAIELNELNRDIGNKIAMLPIK